MFYSHDLRDCAQHGQRVCCVLPAMSQRFQHCKGWVLVASVAVEQGTPSIPRSLLRTVRYGERLRCAPGCPKACETGLPQQNTCVERSVPGLCSDAWRIGGHALHFCSANRLWHDKAYYPTQQTQGPPASRAARPRCRGQRPAPVALLSQSLEVQRTLWMAAVVIGPRLRAVQGRLTALRQVG